MIKRIVTALTLCVILTSLLCGPAAAYGSASENYTDGESVDNKYIIYGSTALCIIPEELPFYGVVPAEYGGAKIRKIICHPDTKQLKRLTVLADDAVIASPAYSSCLQLSEINLKDNVRSITENAFTGTAYYNHIANWEKGALYIGTNLIKVSDWLEGTFTVKEGTTLIADGAFRNCTNIDKVIIPDTVTAIGIDAFADSGIINNPEYYPDESTFIIGDCLISYGGSAAEYTVPEGIRVIADTAFIRAYELECLTVSDGVTHLGQMAAVGCESLKKVSLPKSVEYIGLNVFDGTPLEEITVAKGNTHYASYNSMLYTADFKSLIKCPEQYRGNAVIHPDTEYIEGSAFKNCRAINEVTLPKGLRVIGNNAFGSCSLTNINLPYSLTEIYNGAFAECENITEITLPDSVTHLGRDVFYECLNLKNVTLGKGITRLETAVFSNCKSLEMPRILGNLSHLSPTAFEYTAFVNDPESFDENGLLIISDVFLYKAIEREDGIYRIPEGVRYIAAGCFSEIKNGKKLFLPMSLKLVEPSAYSSENGFEWQIYPGHITHLYRYINTDSDFYISTVASPQSTKAKVIIAVISFAVCVTAVNLSTLGARKKTKNNNK